MKENMVDILNGDMKSKTSYISVSTLSELDQKRGISRFPAICSHVSLVTYKNTMHLQHWTIHMIHVYIWTWSQCVKRKRRLIS